MKRSKYNVRMDPAGKAKRTAPKQASEHQIQSAYFQWVRLTYPGCKLIYAVPNGGKRDKREAAALKREGVTAGVPDINIDIPMKTSFGEYAGMRIETKSAIGKNSDEQITAQGQLSDIGYYVRVCRSPEQMIENTKYYLKGWKWIVPEAI